MTGIFRTFCCICMSVYSIHAVCPVAGSFGGTTSVEKTKRLKGIAVKTLDNACMGAIVEALKNESDRDLFLQFEKLIEAWSASKGFSRSLLSQCADIPFFSGDQEAGRRIVALWEHRNRPLAAAIEHLSNAGRQDEADSLFRAFDRCVRLGPDVLLRWAAVREVRGAYGAALRLYCRCITADSRITGVVLGRLSRLLDNAPRDTIRIALGALERCIFSARGIDTLMAQFWIANAYAKHGSISDEIRILERFGRASRELTVRLLDIARFQERKGAHDLAIHAARSAYGKAQNDQLRSAAAAIACRSFQARHRLDSALIWLGRCDLSSERGRIDAVVLYQQSGKLNKAQSVIGGMRRSFSRDTLEIRQRLFSDDVKEGLEYTKILSRKWTDRADEVILWKVRCLLYCGEPEKAGAILDSVTINTSRESGEELLEYRYYWNMLSRSKEALAVWKTIEYDLYTDQADHAAAAIQGIALPEEMQTALLLRLLRGLKAAGHTALLLGQFSVRSDIPGIPEYLYLYAETLLASGSEKTKVEELLLRLIRDYPADVFSQKARILLSRLRD